MTSFVCSGCGHGSPRWFGRCPECGEWSSASAPASSTGEGERLDLATLAANAVTPARFSTGIAEVDRVLGGGVVPGGAILLSGDPGAGKSTLVMQVMTGAVASGHSSLLITGEESADQVALRARRLGADRSGLQVAASRSLPAVLATSIAERPDLLVIDSIQTLEDPRHEQPAGSVVQVRECASALVAHGKATGTAVFMVGHVTKDGSVAGPKALEHVVDVVLSLDGEGDGTLRLLRPAKNRFGSCDETGVFTMSSTGLEPVEDPSSVLLADRSVGISGSCVFPGVQGSRSLLIEIQALVSKSDYAPPRRVAIGIEQRRMALLLGVMSECLDLKLGDHDVFVSAAGGLAIREPAADVATCLAIHSAKTAWPLPPGAVAIGELGLGGEVRRVPGIERRLVEAHRLGFDAAIVPRGVERGPRGMKLHPVGRISEAMAASSSRRAMASA
jgi:DNA repair protein RadA/Sms